MTPVLTPIEREKVAKRVKEIRAHDPNVGLIEARERATYEYVLSEIDRAKTISDLKRVLKQIVVGFM